MPDHKRSLPHEDDERLARDRRGQRYGHWEDRSTRDVEPPPRERDYDDDDRDDRYDRGGYLGQGGQEMGYVETRRGQHQDGGRYGHGPGSWAPRPSHRGKGPANYTRSDERIRELVCEALTDDHDVDATHIDVTVKDSEVILAGTVDDRRQKRMAEDCAAHIAGVKDVHNQLRIAVDATRR